MRKHFVTIVIIAICIAAASFTINPRPQYEVPFPEGFRMWTHVKTGLLGPTHPQFQFAGGYHHIYANDKAMKGYTSGYFPEGSILIFDVIEANENNGATAEGKRVQTSVMIKDSLKYASTGGWGYEEFRGNDKRQPILTEAKKTQCFNCHSRQPDYVFSTFRE